MDFNVLGMMLDPEKCSKLSMEEKRELVYELSKHPHGTPEMLQSWSRQELLQLLCAEMGKERKYTGLTKLKIIESLLKIVYEKNSRESAARVAEQQISDSVDSKTLKNQRKSDQFSRLTTPLRSNCSNDLASAIYCKNSACKASLSTQDVFCKRCSCCICQKFDDNKDPSLWLTCSSEPPLEGESCNMSCHLQCAIKHERSGLSKMGQVAQLDGSFYCVSCGKMNDLLECWRKQLMIAMDTRRVDILCYRVFLSQKLLCGTNKYQLLSEIVDEAVKKLQAEVGPLTDINVKMGRGIVNRMSAGQEVQRLCASAVKLLDSMLSETTQMLTNHVDQDCGMSAANTIRFEDISDTSITVIVGNANQSSDINVGYTLWHRKAVDEEETREPTLSMSSPGTRVVVQSLAPSTEYVFKVVSFHGFQEANTYEARVSTSAPTEETIPKARAPERSHSPVTNCSTLSNPSSADDEMNITSGLNESNKVDNYFNSYNKNDENMIPTNSMNTPFKGVGSSVSALNEKHALNGVISDQSGLIKLENNEANGSNTPMKTQLENLACLPPAMGLPTPCRMDLKTVRRNGKSKSSKNGVGVKPQPRCLSKKRNRERQEEDCEGNLDLEFYVKVIRRLECEGHIEKSFRQKFLTWYSLRATPREMHAVQVFVNAFRDDRASLAGQLIDAFEDIIPCQSSEALIPSGFCMKLWH